MWNQATPITLTNFALGEVVVRHEAGKRASERTNGKGTGKDSRIGGEKESGREARSGRSHPLASPPPRNSGLVTTAGWYVEPKPYVSSRLTSLSPFPPPCLSSLPLKVLSLSRSIPFTTDQPREPHGSPLFVLFSPSFHPDPRDSHEYSSHDLLGRLGREESSFVYRPFSPHSLSLLILILLSSLSVHRFFSNVVKETLIKPRFATSTSIMWFMCTRSQKKRSFRKHYRGEWSQ